ncbi:MAG: hypothetical protein OJJ54_08385 [Pseudonocardia sp.]|nr:hypothetical protein [Pseudonocardia sp.]
MAVLENQVEPAPTGSRNALGVVAFVAAGALFVLYPALRPYGDATPGGAAAAFASPLWLVAHLAAVAGFVLVGFGLLAFRDRRRTRLTTAGLATWALGTGLVLPYYGAEVFALNAIGQRIAATGDAGLLDLAEAVRMGPAQMTVFGAGLVLLAASGVLTALAHGRLAIPFAVAMVLFLPQFFAGPELRIAHGVLLGIGSVLLAGQLRRAPAARVARAASIDARATRASAPGTAIRPGARTRTRTASR